METILILKKVFAHNHLDLGEDNFLSAIYVIAMQLMLAYQVDAKAIIL